MSFNTTFGGSSAHTASQLYASSNVDFTQLNWFERHWMTWYMWIGNPLIATGIASFILHEVRSLSSTLYRKGSHTLMQTVYFGRCIPWIIIDAIPYFRRWKLQPGKLPTPQEQWECTKGVLFSHFTIEGPAVSVSFAHRVDLHADWTVSKILLFHPVAESFGMSTWQVPFPSWKIMVPQLAFFFVFEDMFHYFCSCASPLCARVALNHVDPPPYSSSTPPHTLTLQTYSQAPPQILCTLWPRRGIRTSAGSHDPRNGHNSRSPALLRVQFNRAHRHRLHLDHPPPFPGHRCALRIW